jgi:hypothetical protein
VKPAIVDIYTSPKSDPPTEKRGVFRPGTDSLQWNVVMTVAPDLPTGGSYRLRFILQPMEIARFYRNDYLEVIWRPQRIAVRDLSYLWQTWWVAWGTPPEVIPSVPTNTSMPKWPRSKLIHHLADLGDDEMLYVPGFWKFTAIIEDTGSDRHFDAMDGWYYRIEDSGTG